jgi:tagatose 6-phosphate kinase
VAGGKGINVSFQLKNLGIPTIASGFLGGEVGRIIKSLIDREKVKNDFIFIKDTTRIGFTVLNEQNLEQTSVFEPGHKVTKIEIQNLIKKIATLSKKSDWLVLSGSVPHRNLTNIYRDLIKKARTMNPNIKIALDSYGDEFVSGLKMKPFLVKQNKNEYEKTFHKQLNDESDYLEALNYFSTTKTSIAVITNNDNPVYFYYDNKYYKAFPPRIKIINPIGSGDCLLAGIIYGFLKNFEPIDIIKFSMAAAVANAKKWEIAKCNVREIKSILNSIEVVML